ncbi:carbohydrate binding domain-containing protein [Clostridium beijerinckii]|uniref:Family 16 glycosylhydrolase n=2 Tax=Clostridium beijerinckii TaxID=1520 RepID=A0A7X9SKZ1_CLOBE|nr:carbohydrate binding domain-containing protein [Clostridium beijerinckii]NMF03567.1 family 16 glycosylhydrolase [Clostridium beijerinckii]
MKSIKLKKIIAVAVAASMIPVMLQSGVNAEWKQSTNNGSWSYVDDSGLATNWKLIDGKWYNFDESGVMKTGWINDNGIWYFANASGEMQTGWVNDKGIWYFTDTSGAMQTGWINDRGTWYFTDTTGAMKTGWVNDKETWYFTDASGAMQTGVIEVDGKVYSLASSGAMQTGKVIIDNKEYNFSNSGEAVGEIPQAVKAFDNKGVGVTKQADKPTTTETLPSSTASKNSSSHSSSSGNSGSNSGNSGSNPGNSNQEQDKWKLVWSDEFNGTSLDPNKWSYQYGNGDEYGAVDWGNNEKEYYTDQNTKVEDGDLVIEARKEDNPDQFGGKKYSSARIRTLGKFSKTYGKIEAAITMPKGQGLWPAFWMLPDDDNIYGKWASGGEIDIMEAKGGHPNNVWGTIHFGKEWPNNTSSGGHYTFPEGKDISGQHIYSVEWEPGEIRWYVDGELYYTANNWFSQGNDQPAPYAYPAPFDRNFHIILNMAVGGAYDGNVEPDDSFKSADMKVDYVRVYDLNGQYPVHANPATYEGPLVGARTPLANGSYILDPSFKSIKATDTDNLSFDNWNFLTASGGQATFTNDNGLDIDIKKGGTVNYGVQLVDHVPLRLNKKYTLKFKAKADKNASVQAQFGGGADRGYTKYSDAFKVDLTTEEKEYEYSFVMKDTPNVHGRLEFNLGLTDDVNINLNDVEVTESDADVEDNASTAKEPLDNGNHIYNGDFNLGDNGMGFWDFKGEGATIKSDKDKKEADITLPAAGDKNSVILSQSGTNLLQSDVYKLTFKASASKDRPMDVRFASKDGQTTYAQNTFNLTTEDSEYDYEFTMQKGTTDVNSITQFLMGNADGDVYIHDIQLIRTTNNNVNYDGVDLYPIKNGDFSLGYNYWQTMDNQGTPASKADFSITDDANKAAAIDVKALGDSNWNVMLYSNDMKLSKGVSYTLEFDAWADQARDIVAKIEENANYTSYTSKTLSLKPDKQHVILNFTMPKDDTAQLKFCMGNTSSPALGKVYIDNVSLRVKNAPVKMPATLVLDTTDNKIGNDINIAYAGGDSGWKDSIKEITVEDKNVDPTLYKVSDGQITLDKSLFTKQGDYNIIVKSDGFDDADVKQSMIDTSVNNNLISNGDFSSEFENWTHFATTPAAATFSITDDADKTAAIDVQSTGEADWNVMLFSDNIKLAKDTNYVLEFDAWADEDRDILAEIQQNADPYTTYASEAVALDGNKKHVTLKFTMKNDDKPQVKFCCGKTNNPKATKIYIDNVSLKVDQNK